MVHNDTERILTVLDGNIQLLKLIVALQFTLPGVPLIYYGDEAGLRVEKIRIIERVIHGDMKIMI